MSATGLVFNIQRFSVHDGPGIRTTVFLKGCTLECSWCHNTEGKVFGPEMLVRQELCTGCAACVDVCPAGAVTVSKGKAETDREVCTTCGQCVARCPAGGRAVCGQQQTVDQVVAEVAKDQVFYRQSGGGVTFSGGEAMAQIDFLSELLAACKDQGLHTAVDTAGHVPWSSFERVLEPTDLFLYDLKTMDDRKHRLFTGASNHRVLENLRRLAAVTDGIVVRIPVVPGVNDDDENLARMLAFIGQTGLRRVDLLPFHQLGRAKARRLGHTWDLAAVNEPGAGEMQSIGRRFSEAGIETTVGGIV